jgi:anti-sigma B factor antagonist
MDIVESQAGKVVVLMPTGRLDSTTVPVFSARMNTLFDAGTTAVLVDMAHLSYLTSTSFRALALAHRRAETGGIAFGLCGLNGIVQELFELTGFSDSFAIYPNRAAGLAALTEKAGG